jgi:hypothetical protein
VWREAAVDPAEATKRGWALAVRKGVAHLGDEHADGAMPIHDIWGNRRANEEAGNIAKKHS